MTQQLHMTAARVLRALVARALCPGGCMSAATLRQAVVLVGGRGTRLGSLTTAMPKPLLDVGGRPFLAWLLRELCRYGVEQVLLLAAFRADLYSAVIPELTSFLPKKLHLEVLDKSEPAGTGGALHYAGPHLDEQFLLLNGDSIFEANLARLLADAARDPPDVLGRLLLRRVFGASGCGIVRFWPAIGSSPLQSVHRPQRTLLS